MRNTLMSPSLKPKDPAPLTSLEDSLRARLSRTSVPHVHEHRRRVVPLRTRLPFEQGEQLGQADFIVEGKTDGPGAIFLRRAVSHSRFQGLKHHNLDHRSRLQPAIDDELHAAARDVSDARGIEEMVPRQRQLKPGSDVRGKSNMPSAIRRTRFGHHSLTPVETDDKGGADRLY